MDEPKVAYAFVARGKRRRGRPKSTSHAPSTRIYTSSAPTYDEFVHMFDTTLRDTLQAFIATYHVSLRVLATHLQEWRQWSMEWADVEEEKSVTLDPSYKISVGSDQAMLR